MRIIARMYVGGPAVQVSELMHGFNSTEFDLRLYASYCAAEEAGCLDTVAIDVKSLRILGFGQRISLVGDIKAFIALVKETQAFKPHVIHAHTKKAGFLGRIASIVSLQPLILLHTFHGHLLNGYFWSFKRLLSCKSRKFVTFFTHKLLATMSDKSY